MSLYDAAVYLWVALLVAALLYVRRKVSGRQRLRLGVVLFVVGSAGILLALRLSHLPLFQSEVVAYAWIGLCAAAVVAGILFLVTATVDWLGVTRPRHERRQFPPFR
jgi:NADH:ubiquinone oxidoreductase subunit H